MDRDGDIIEVLRLHAIGWTPEQIAYDVNLGYDDVIEIIQDDAECGFDCFHFTAEFE